MSERGLHFIEDDLSETWIEDWAGAGIAEIELLLARDVPKLDVEREES